MEYEAQKVGEVKGLGIIYRADAPLNRQLEAFEKVGINTLATPEEVAQIRLADIADNWSRTNMAPIARKGAKTILVRNSPLMNSLMAVSAVKAHSNSEYPTMGKEVYEAAEAIAINQTGIEPEDRSAILLSKEGDLDLTSEMDETRFVLGRSATPYFVKFVKGGKEGKIHFYNLSGTSKDKTDVNYLWFGYPLVESGLAAGDWGLYDDYGAFGGVGSAEGSARKNGYTLTEIAKANSEVIPVVFEKAKVPGLASMVSRDLNQSLLAKLRKQ